MTDKWCAQSQRHRFQKSGVEPEADPKKGPVPQNRLFLLSKLPMLTEGSEICWGYVHDRMLDGTPKDVANPGRPADSPLGMRIRKKKQKLSEFRSIKSISYWQFSQFGPVREREREAWVPVHVVADPGNEPAIIKISFSHRSIRLEISSQYVTVKPVIGSGVERWQHQLHLFKKTCWGSNFRICPDPKLLKQIRNRNRPWVCTENC